MTREEEIKLERDITKHLEEEHLYPEYVRVEQWRSPFIQIEIKIEGDWKHDHLRTEYIMENSLFSKLNLVGLTHRQYEVGHSESDYYTAVHIWNAKVDN